MEDFKVRFIWNKGKWEIERFINELKGHKIIARTKS